LNLRERESFGEHALNSIADRVVSIALNWRNM